VTLEPADKADGARDIVRYETATAQREVLVSASQLVPSGSDKPLAIEDYAWSADMNRLLIFTNSQNGGKSRCQWEPWRPSISSSSR
jgi:dipeptidyl-peptidase 4